MATTDSREARRRKILERGSQRLGLIIGRIQEIPPPPSPPSISHLQPSQVSSQPSDSLDNNQQPPPLSSDQFTEDKAFQSILSDQNNVADAGQSKADGRGSSVGPSSNELQTSVSEASSQRKSSLLESETQSSLGSSSASGQSVVRDISFKTVFTPNQINSAIAATEKTRLICSATIAFLVVLSFLGFPLLGSYIMKGVITFRPLYLVLLTDVTLVLAQLLFGNQKGSASAGKVQDFIPTVHEYGWAEQVSKLLEAAFLMRKVLDAVFMDCSVYCLIVICGLALAW